MGSNTPVTPVGLLFFFLPLPKQFYFDNRLKVRRPRSHQVWNPDHVASSQVVHHPGAPAEACPTLLSGLSACPAGWAYSGPAGSGSTAHWPIQSAWSSQMSRCESEGRPGDPEWTRLPLKGPPPTPPLPTLLLWADLGLRTVSPASAWRCPICACADFLRSLPLGDSADGLAQAQGRTGPGSVMGVKASLAPPVVAGPWSLHGRSPVCIDNSLAPRSPAFGERVTSFSDKC